MAQVVIDSITTEHRPRPARPGVDRDTDLLHFARITAALRMKVEDLRAAGQPGWCNCTRKAESSTPYRAITQLARGAAPTSTTAGNSRGSARAGCFAPARATTRRHVDRSSYGAGGRPAHDPQACRRGQHRGADRVTRFDRHHEVLENGGSLENAEDMAAHASPRTTRLYDRRRERLTQDEVERIRL